MAEPVSIFLGVFQIVVQLIATYFSYRIYKYSNKVWFAVTLALILMTFRRITALSIELGFFTSGGMLEFVDRFVLPSMISVLLLAGFWSMKKLLYKVFGSKK